MAGDGLPRTVANYFRIPLGTIDKQQDKDTSTRKRSDLEDGTQIGFAFDTDREGSHPTVATVRMQSRPEATKRLLLTHVRSMDCRLAW